MTDHFADLGLPQTITLSVADLDEARDEAGRLHHPDQREGNPEIFAAVNTAYQVLRSPARRCRHLHELLTRDCGKIPERNAALPADLGDLFMEIGALFPQADALIEQKDGSSTALTLALLIPKCLKLHAKIEAVQAKVDSATQDRIAIMNALDLEQDRDEVWLARLAECGSSLSFLEKWQAQLRERWTALAPI